MTTSTIRVLVVDDYEPWRRFFSSTLQKQPEYQVIGEVSDGLESVQQAEQLQPDLILLDIVMPKRNGFEALRGVRKDERTKQARVIVVSSKNQESDRVWGKRQGADEYLAKPFTADQLLALVRRFLR